MFVASEKFVSAAAAQGKALGMQPPGVYVPHPIQDRTDDEMSAMAEAVVEALVAALTTPA